MLSNVESEERTPGTLGAEITRLVVRLLAEFTGRGPTRARTTIRENVVVCITENNLTKAEQRLAADGEEQLVVTVRRRFQAVMRDDLVAGVETLTGRKVISFLSDQNAKTDHAAEIFVLDGPPALDPPAG